MRACGRCLMLKEWDDDALHDGRPAGPASGRRDDVGSPPPRGVRGMSGRGGGAVPACRAAQGAAGAPAGARPLARRARGGARRTPAAAQPLGPVEPRGGGGRGRAHRAPSDLDQPAGRGRARPREAAVRDAGAGVGALRPRRPRDQRPVGGARSRPGRPHCADRRGADAAGPTDPGPPRGTRETLAAAGGPDAAAHERPRLPRQLRGAVRPRRILSMQRKWIVMATAALAAWPGGLVAQQPPRAPRAPRVFTYSVTDNRGRIGVVVRTDADPETDKVGAKIEGVTPGGPADKAGLKVGDIITKFNGTSLAGAKAEDEEESGPGSKLIELARKLAPGDTARLEYRRGTDAKKATLVAERSEEHTSELQSHSDLVCRLLLATRPHSAPHSFPTRRSSDLRSATLSPSSTGRRSRGLRPKTRRSRGRDRSSSSWRASSRPATPRGSSTDGGPTRRRRRSWPRIWAPGSGWRCRGWRCQGPGP